MAKKQLIDALNQDLAFELAAIAQYMWHHDQWSSILGVKSLAEEG